MAKRSIFTIGEEFGCDSHLIVNFLQYTMGEEFSKLSLVDIDDKTYNFLKNNFENNMIEFFNSKGLDIEDLSNIDWFELEEEFDYTLNEDLEDFLSARGIKYSLNESSHESELISNKSSETESKSTKVEPPELSFFTDFYECSEDTIIQFLQSKGYDVNDSGDVTEEMREFLLESSADFSSDITDFIEEKKSEEKTIAPPPPDEEALPEYIVRGIPGGAISKFLGSIFRSNSKNLYFLITKQYMCEYCNKKVKVIKGEPSDAGCNTGRHENSSGGAAIITVHEDVYKVRSGDYGDGTFTVTNLRTPYVFHKEHWWRGWSSPEELIEINPKEFDTKNNSNKKRKVIDLDGRGTIYFKEDAYYSYYDKIQKRKRYFKPKYKDAALGGLIRVKND